MAKNIVEQELKRFSDVAAISDTLRMRSLQMEFISKVPNYSEGEEEYALYNMLAGMASFSLGEIEKSIPNLLLAHKGLGTLSPQPEALNYFLSLVSGCLGCAYAYTDRQNDACRFLKYVFHNIFSHLV